jgi:hypothetical protein
VLEGFEKCVRNGLHEIYCVGAMIGTDATSVRRARAAVSLPWYPDTQKVRHMRYRCWDFRDVRLDETHCSTRGTVVSERAKK